MIPVRRAHMSAHQSGFSTATAVFVLLILASLAAAMVTFASAQHLASAQDIQGSRAYQAARSGIEWGLYRLANSAAGDRCGSVGSASFGLAGTTLADFTVTVNCERFGPYTEGANNLSIYRLTATACTQPSGGACPGSAGSLGYVERQLQATLEY